MKMKTKMIRLTPDLESKVKRLAKVSKTSESEVVRAAIRDFGIK